MLRSHNLPTIAFGNAEEPNMATHEVRDGSDEWLTLAGESIRVRVVGVHNGQVELQVDAPPDNTISLINAADRAHSDPCKHESDHAGR